MTARPRHPVRLWRRGRGPTLSRGNTTRSNGPARIAASSLRVRPRRPALHGVPRQNNLPIRLRCLQPCAPFPCEISVRSRAACGATSDGMSWSRRWAPRSPAPLTAALERIHVLTATGKIDRAGLRALRDEVEQARQVGMIGQQLDRFASGRVRQSHEVLQLEEVLKSVLALRGRETQARGIAPEAAAQVGARRRRRLAPLQPAQRHAGLGAGQRPRAHRLHDRLQDLAGPCPARPAGSRIDPPTCSTT